jgi:hypothetical protein
VLAELLGPAQHFAGRDGELAPLSERRRHASADRQTVLLGEEAGVGRRRWSKPSCAACGWPSRTSWGRFAEQYGSGEPYLPIIELLD